MGESVRMSAREGQWVTEVGDTEGEIMGDRKTKRQKQGERERKNARKRKIGDNGEGSNREWKHGGTESTNRQWASERVSNRGAAGLASPRESRTDTENV